MISNLHFDRERVRDFDELVGRYAKDEFASSFRSTVPLLALSQDAPGVFSAILAACQMQQPADIHFEYTVSSPRGTGKPSHTDVVVLAADAMLAVEAKWGEPRYETVGTWLGKAKPDDNRWKVMEGWLQLLEPHAALELKVDDFRDAVYQMVHRAASACSTAKLPRLAYLHFTPPPDRRAATSDQYLADLRHLHGLLVSPAAFPFYLVEVRATPTAAFAAIAGLPKGSAATSEPVRRALCTGGSFEFALGQVHSMP